MKQSVQHEKLRWWGAIMNLSAKKHLVHPTSNLYVYAILQWSLQLEIIYFWHHDDPLGDLLCLFPTSFWTPSAFLFRTRVGQGFCWQPGWTSRGNQSLSHGSMFTRHWIFFPENIPVYNNRCEPSWSCIAYCFLVLLSVHVDIYLYG